MNARKIGALKCLKHLMTIMESMHEKLNNGINESGKGMEVNYSQVWM